MFVNQRENLTSDQESLRALFHAPLLLLEHFKKKGLDVSLGSCHGNSCTEICAHGEGVRVGV